MLGEAKRLASLMVLESLKIDALGVSWEAFWESLGALTGLFGDLLGALGNLLEASWSPLEVSWSPLRGFW